MILLATVLCGMLARPQPEEGKPVRYEDLPPAAKLGVRVDSVRRAWPTAPFVVIVPTASAYIEAIGRWTPQVRFPVLLDDGTAGGREDIARFVRGFGQARVVRWAGKVGAGGQEAVDAALRRVWSGMIPGEESDSKVETAAALIARWRAINVPRSGIVVASMEDPAWTAALALSAGRAQPLAWVKRPPGVIDAKLDKAAMAAFESAVEQACEATGLAWKSLGDDIDAVTICMSSPSKAQGDAGAILAMSDVLCRSAGGNVGSGARWAWASQIAGSEARSAYTAMCALFLSPKSAWLFDGYPTKEPWSSFAMKAGVQYLSRVGIEPVVDESPKGGESAWRSRASSAMDAGLILVNTKGMPGEFFLEPGRCLPADVPVLKVPAMLHLVHSWSAVGPFDRGTLGGRWLERGVYAYLGSVDEPYLNAFIPSSVVIGRLVSKFPFGAAVRIDGAPAWKLATFGDPLAMMGIELPRIEHELPLEDCASLTQDLADALKEEDFARAIRTMSLLGLDSDIAILVNGLGAEKADRLTPEAAEGAILALFRAGEGEAMIRCFALLREPVAERGDLRDALWHYARRALGGTRDAALVSLLRRNIRPDARMRDTLDLAEAYAAILGHDKAVEMLKEQRGLLSDSTSKQRIDEQIKYHTAKRAR